MPANRWRISPDHRRLLIGLGGLALVLVGVSWAQAYLLLQGAYQSQVIINSLLPGGRPPSGGVTTQVVILVGVLAGASALTIVASWLRSFLQQACTRRLQERLLSALSAELLPARVARAPGAVLKTFVNDAGAVAAGLVFGLVGALEAGLRFAIYSVGLWQLPDGWLIWLVLGIAALGLQLLVARLFLGWERRAQQQADDLGQQWFAEATRYFELLGRLLYFGTETAFGRAVIAAGQRQDQARRRANLLANSREAVAGLLATLSFPLCVLLLLGSARVSAGEIVQAQILSNLLLGSIAALTALPAVWRQNRPSWERVRQLLRQSVAEPVPAAGPVLAARQPGPALRFVGVGYQPREAGPTILSGVSFELPPGSCVGLVGASGSGKTTLALLAAGDLLPTTGEIFLDEVNLTHWPLLWRRDLIAYLPAEFGFLDASVRDNVRLGRPLSDDEVETALRRAGLEQVFAGSQLTVEHRIRTLSGEGYLSFGQRRRLGLAQILIGRQPIVILDEPTANLDPETAGELARQIRGNFQDRTLLVITHEPELFATVYNLFVADGGLVAVGTHAQLLREQPRYRELWSTRRAASTSE